MNKVNQWIRRLWEQRKAPEPVPHPDVGRHELARLRALMCLGLAACGTAKAGSTDAAAKAEVVDVAPLEPTKAAQPTRSDQAPLGRPPQQLRPLRVDPWGSPFMVGPDLPSNVRRF